MHFFVYKDNVVCMFAKQLALTGLKQVIRLSIMVKQYCGDYQSKIFTLYLQVNIVTLVGFIYIP